MIIYNVTMMIDPEIAGRWISWMKAEYIPRIMASGCFDDYKLVRLLDMDETQGLTYAAQFHAPDRASYDRYITEFAPALGRETAGLWEGKIVAFSTLMEVVN